MSGSQQHNPESAPATDTPDGVEWRARGEFVDILDRLGISIVLSTRPNHIIFLGARSGALTFFATQMVQPLGLAVGPDRIAVATVRSIAVFANVARLAAHYPPERD